VVDRDERGGLVCGVPSPAAGLVDAHVHLTFATHGANPAPRGSAEIQQLYLRAQADAGVTLVRDCGAIPGAVAPPTGPGLPAVVSCGPLLAPDIAFLAHLREPVAPDALEAVACERIAGGAAWIKLLADAPGPDGNMLAAQPTYPVQLVQRVWAAVHDAGGRVAAHTTGPIAPELVDAGVDSIEHGNWLDAGAVARLGARGGAWTPTLSTVTWYLDPLIAAGHPAAPMLERHLETLAVTLSGALAAGVVVLAGTDERPHGSIREEIDLLARFGLTPAEAQAAASTAARDYLAPG
jgi:imidazolonepropionase-like amidohydrolase